MMKSPTTSFKNRNFDDDDDDDRRNYLPECWSDDKRMDVLFNPFRIREINPDGWDLKMNFWINLINKWCLHERRIVFTVDDIRKTFIRQERFPHLDCIKLVLTHMKRRGKVILKSELSCHNYSDSRKQSPSSSWTLASLFVKPFTFGWNMLAKESNNTTTTNQDEPDRMINFDTECQFINRDALDTVIESIHSCVKQSDVTCMNYTKFIRMLNQKIFTDKTIDDTSLQVILTILEEKNIIRIHSETGGFKIVKFGDDISIRDSDILLVKLELTREVLERETNRLEEKIEQFDCDARNAAKNGYKEKALNFLKRKKRMQLRLNEKDQQIDNIEMIYGQLLESGSQKLMLQAFQMANQILKRESGKLEEAEIIISQLDETLGDISNLNQEINRPIITGDDFDAENELEEILKELQVEKSETEKRPVVHSSNEDVLINELEKLSVIDDDEPKKIKKKESDETAVLAQ